MATQRKASPASWRQHFGALLSCVVTATVAWPLSKWLDLANIVMLFLLTVVVVAVRFGRRPAIVAAFFSVALFDFLYVPPQFSFAVNDVQYLVTFAVMLVVALTVGHLTTALTARAEDAQAQADEQHALYRLAQTLAGTLTITQSVEAVRDFARERFAARVIVLLPGADPDGRLQALAPEDESNLSSSERAAAEAVFTSAALIDSRTLGIDDGERLLLCMRGATRHRGVVIFAAHDLTQSPATSVAPEPLTKHKELLQAVTSILTTAAERLHYVEVAGKAELSMEAERLRSSILAALSHDVRTPLTAMYGLADTIATDPSINSTEIREAATALRLQSLQLNAMVTNLLDMARLQAGALAVKLEWQPLEEVIGASIRFATSALNNRRVDVALAPNMPLVNIDAVLIERVLCNLFENAAKYASAGSNIALSAGIKETLVEISVTNEGKGFPSDRLEAVFALFERGEHESSVPGMGVGLAICRAIITAHGGSIRAENPASGGARVVFSLPRGMPPTIELDDDHTVSPMIITMASERSAS